MNNKYSLALAGLFFGIMVFQISNKLNMILFAVIGFAIGYFIQHTILKKKRIKFGISRGRKY